MKEKEILEFANKQGLIHNYAEYLGKWKDYDVYELVISKVMCYYVGLPRYALVKENKIRISEPEESMAILDFFYLDEQNDKNEQYIAKRELQNSPIEIKENTTIESFKFEIGGFVGSTEVFEYRIKYGEKILTYKEKFFNGEEIYKETITIKNEKFNENIIEMIKYFHEDFGENPYICDGEWYKFKAKLSNGQKLKSSGYNYFPRTYNQFKEYLGILFKN